MEACWTGRDNFHSHASSLIMFSHCLSHSCPPSHWFPDFSSPQSFLSSLLCVSSFCPSPLAASIPILYKHILPFKLFLFPLAPPVVFLFFHCTSFSLIHFWLFPHIFFLLLFLSNILPTLLFSLSRFSSSSAVFFPSLLISFCIPFHLVFLSCYC